MHWKITSMIFPVTRNYGKSPGSNFPDTSHKITEKYRNITEFLLNDRRSTVKIQIFANFFVKLQDFQNYQGNCKQAILKSVAYRPLIFNSKRIMHVYAACRV